MIIFWKQIGLVLQIVLVVAAVLLFSFFDPFNLLKSKKLKLENTPINVQSIREIGQLITAEYYGEVLNSLQQSRIDKLIDENIDFKFEYTSIHEQFKIAVSELIEDKDIFKVSGWDKKNDIYEYFYFRFSTLTENPYYQDYMLWLTEKLGKKNEKQLLKELYFEDKDLTLAFEKIKPDELAKAIEKITNSRLNELSADKKFRKRQIVVLGRGWVKAGVDFKNFTEDNLQYDVENKTIHLIGLKPEILSCTINPWFIPEKQVKGFEVILVSNKANKPEYMQIVKEETLKKLRANALEANILEQAKINAENNLKDFFSLLIEGGIDRVIFHEDFFSYFDASMATDSLTPRSLIRIDSLLVRRYLSDSSQVMVMRDSLKYKRKVYLGDSAYRIQRFSSLLTYVEDEELSAGDLAELETLHQSILSGLSSVSDTSVMFVKGKTGLNTMDSIWYFPDRKTLNAIRLLNEKQVRPDKPFTNWQIFTNNAKYVSWDSSRKENFARLVLADMLRQKENDYDQLIVQIKSHVMQLVVEEKTFINNFVKDGNASSRDTIIDGQIMLYTNDIRKEINGHLLFYEQTILNADNIKNLIDSISDLMLSSNPGSFIPTRDSIQKKYVFCLSTDCYSINRYTDLIALADIDSASVLVVELFEKEALNIQSDKEAIIKSDQVKHIDRMDSVWFFPSDQTLEEFMVQTNEVYPNDGVSGFFNRTFRKEKFKTMQLQKEQFYHNLIYDEMLDEKSLDLQKALNAVSEELKQAEKPKVVSR